MKRIAICLLPMALATAPAGAQSIAAALEGALAASFLPVQDPPPDPGPRTDHLFFLPQGMRDFVVEHNVQLSLNVDLVWSLLDAREPDHDDVEHAFIRELELAFGIEITPDIWFDIQTAWEREGDDWETDVEEAYLTLLNLPGGVQARVGRFIAAFGKAGRYHTHARPWVDSPLVIEAFLGEESLRGHGGSVNVLIPNPWDVYSDLTVEFFEPVHGSESAGVELRERGGVVHLRNVITANESTTVEAGLSGAIVRQRENESDARIAGVDLTVKWIPIEEALYRSFTWQTEVLLAQVDSIDFDERDSHWGGYTSGELQVSRRNFIGVRGDWVQSVEGGRDMYGVSPFHRIQLTERIYGRTQLSVIWHDPEADDETLYALFFQLNVSLGKHRAHAY